MQIDDVKPPTSNRFASDRPADAPAEQKGSIFAEVKGSLRSSGAERADHALAVASRFSRTDMEDPKKLQDMVRASVSELVDSGSAVTGPLPEAQKGFLVDLLSQDPLLSRQIENYLRKVLT